MRETDWSAFTGLGRVRHFRDWDDVRLLPLRRDEALSQACVEEVCHYLSQVKSCFFQDSVVQLIRSRCFGRIQFSERFDGHLWCDVEADAICRQWFFEFLEVWLSSPPQTLWNYLQVRCDCDLVVLSLFSRLVDN